MRCLQGDNQSRCWCRTCTLAHTYILKNVKQGFINLQYLVYLVGRTTLKDQTDIKGFYSLSEHVRGRTRGGAHTDDNHDDDHIQPQRADVGAYEDHRGEPSLVHGYAQVVQQ